MKFNISSKVLMGHLSALSKVVNSKNTITILDNFLFDLNENELEITGSDQETTMKTHLTVENGEGKGSFAVNVKWLLNLLKELPEQQLEFVINDENLEITIYYLNGKFNFVGISGDEFPQKNANESTLFSVEIPAKEIVKSIEQTIFAVATEDLRPVMMGILWDIKPEYVVFVASDTHKLVKYTNDRIKSNFEASFILPTKPAAILNNILSKNGDEIVKVSIAETCATFETGAYSLNCRFINGRYPNYNSVIPKENPYEVTIDRITLLNAIRRVSVFASSGGLIKLELRQNEIFLTAQDVDFATQAEETIACSYVGDAMIMGFNDAKIIEVLNNISVETVTLRLSSPSRAGIFEPAEQKENENLLVLLMPMMI